MTNFWKDTLLGRMVPRMENKAVGRKYIRISPEVSVTACAATRDATVQEVLSDSDFDDHFQKPNLFWSEDPHHERARLKVYKNNPERTVIPMPFLGQNADNGWAELQLRIKRSIVREGTTVHLRPVKIGRHKSFDPRIGESGQWVSETNSIEPRRDNKSHYFLSFRIYHQDHFPETPGDWHWEPVYVAIAGNEFFRIDVLWEKEKIAITVTPLDPNSPEIPGHIRPPAKAIQEEMASVLRRAK